MKRNLYRNISILLLAAISLSSCKKYYNPEPKFEEYEQEVSKTVKRKVLMISIDGLVGQEVKKNIPTNIAALMKNSKYSFDALTDENTSDVASWATMVTGFNAKVHRVVTDSYLPAPSSDNPHGTIEFVPSVIYRLEDYNPSLRTSIIVQDDGLANILLMDADDNILVNTDEKVKNETLALLAKFSPDLCVLQFKDVLKAGVQAGFSMEESAYKSAVEKVDTYIGEILTALKARENYQYEDWLIIVNSSHGGVGKTYGGESFPERNIFTLYHQKDFKQTELIPEIIVAPHFYGFDGTESGPKVGVRARNITEANGEVNYNPSNTGKLTIEAKIKTNKNAAGSWSYNFPPFLSKVSARSGSTPGWSFFRAGNNVAFWVGDGSTAIELAAGPVSINDEWAHITGTIEPQGNTVVTRFYLNGSKIGESSKVMNINNIKSTSPLTFGFQPTVFSGGFIDTYISDVHIWNTVLTEDEIRDNSRRMGVADNHAKINNLVGNWPMADGGPILYNKIVGMPNIPLQGSYQYKVLGNNLSFVDESSVLIQNIDVVSQVFYWLGIVPKQNWALEGSVFLSKYELEFLK